MGLDTAIRKGVATANKITKSLQVTVQHYAWTGDDAYNKPTFAAAVPRKAIVVYTSRLRRVKSGDLVNTKAEIYFLAPITAQGATNRKEPVDPRDKFVLPNGQTGPVLDLDEMVADPLTGFEYFNPVVLGGD